eukprot:7385059-Prymnesium_polylepis.1
MGGHMGVTWGHTRVLFGAHVGGGVRVEHELEEAALVAGGHAEVVGQLDVDVVLLPRLRVT